MNAGTVILAFPAVYFLYTSKSGTSNSQVLFDAVHDSGLAIISSESKCYPSHMTIWEPSVIRWTTFLDNCF